MDGGFHNPMTIEGGLLYDDVYGGLLAGILDDEESQEQDRYRKNSSPDDDFDDDYNDGDFDDDYDDDEYGDEAILKIDWSDHDEIMHAVQSGKFDSSDIESMIEHAMSDGVYFDEDDVDEICSQISRNNLKSRLRSQI